MRIKPVSLVVAVMVSFCLLSMLPENSLAQQKQFIFEKNVNYDIYYSLEDTVQYVTNVKIIDTIAIEEVTFLEIQSPGIATAALGYIALPSVKAILPTGSPRPQNI